MRSTIPLLLLLLLVQRAGNAQSAVNSSAEVRTRFEPRKQSLFSADDPGGLLYQRIRFNITAEPLPWLRTEVQAQDAETLPDRSEGSNADIRQMYFELGTEGSHWRARVGRQELGFGDENLIGADSEWCNVGRVFDAARITFTKGRVQIDGFAGGLVEQAYSTLDRSRWRETLLGSYVAVSLPAVRIEPFVVIKVSPENVVKTFGAHFAREMSDARWTLDGDAVLQRNRGTAAGAAGIGLERTFAGNLTAGAAVRLATGGSGDGRWGTFDDLYPNGYNDFGLLDPFAWRNVRELAANVGWRPVSRLQIGVGYSRYWAFDRNAGVFIDNGPPAFRLPPGTSAELGGQLNASARVAVASAGEITAGVAAFQPVEALRSAGEVARARTVYVAWRKHIQLSGRKSR